MTLATFFAAAAAVTAALAASAQTNIYDVSKDFSILHNPSSVWTYGWKTSLAGPLVPFAFAKDSPLASWSKNGVEPSEVLCNQTASTVYSDGGAGAYPPGTLIVQAGYDFNTDNFGVVRFITPAGGDGNYVINARVKTYLDGAASHDADFHLVYNGQEIYSRFMDPNSSAGTTNILSLVEGDTVDFAVGRGADGQLYGSGLKLEATIAQVPVPVTLAIAPQGGFFTNSLAVALTTSDTNVVIHYTLDGTTPVSSSPIYSGNIVLTHATEIRAQEFSGGAPVSNLVIGRFQRVYIFGDDGIPADWRIRYFGTNYAADVNAEASADPDGDGIDNLDEYLTGSNPLVSNSTNPFMDLRLVPNIGWTSVSNTVYRVQRRYLDTTNWVSLTPDVLATGNRSTFVDENSTNSAVYRILTVSGQ